VKYPALKGGAFWHILVKNRFLIISRRCDRIPLMMLFPQGRTWELRPNWSLEAMEYWSDGFRGIKE